MSLLCVKEQGVNRGLGIVDPTVPGSLPWFCMCYMFLGEEKMRVGDLGSEGKGQQWLDLYEEIKSLPGRHVNLARLCEWGLGNSAQNVHRCFHVCFPM